MIKQTKLWNGKSDVLLNLIRETAHNSAYKEDVPEFHISGNAEADIASIHEIGDIITSNNSYTETFYDALYGVIGAQIVSGWYYTNKYKAFKKGLMQIGDVIQIVRPKAFKGQAMPKEVAQRFGADVDAPNRHGVDTQYFARNLMAKYKDTIDRDELKRAFASVSSFDSFVSAKLQTVYNMYEVDEQLTFKYLTLTAINQNNMATVEYTYADNAEINAKNLIKAVKNTCGKMTYPTEDWNLAHVLNSVTDRNALNVVLPIEVSTDISVDALAGAFNLDKIAMSQKLYEIDRFELTDYEAIRLACIGVIPSSTTKPDGEEETYITGMDEFGTPIYILKADVPTATDVVGFIFADDFYQIYDNLFEMYTRMNESGVFQNYFLHVWQTWAVSMFAQSAVIKKTVTKGPTITYNEVSDLVEGTTQVRYAKSNYTEDRWSSDEAYLADESTVIHSGEAVDLGQELVTVTVWNNDNAHKSMACLAVNTNGVRLTEDFTITESDNKVYTVSSNFTLVEEPDVDLTIDIVYTPYFDLLFFPAFYQNTLYSDGGTTVRPRIVKAPANIYFDEIEMSIKPNDESGTVTFYIDSFNALNEYMVKFINMMKRYLILMPWDDINIADTYFYNNYLPCFDERQYNSIIDNLKNSAQNTTIISDKNIINDNRNKLYPIVVRQNSDNTFIYDSSYYSADYRENIAFTQILTYFMVNTDGDPIIGDISTELESELNNFTNLMLNIDEISCLCAERGERSNIMFSTYTCFIGKAYKQIANEYEFIDKYYLPKLADNTNWYRNIKMTNAQYTDTEAQQEGLDATVDTDKTKTSNYYIAVACAKYIVDDVEISDKYYRLPTALLPFYTVSANMR